MKNRTGIVKSLILGLLTLVVSGSALADWSWNFTGSSSGNSNGMTFSGSGGAPDVTVTAWSNSKSASRGSSNYGTGDLTQRSLKKWSGGLGVESPDDVGQGSPEHAIDNEKRIDAILLDFGGTAVTLDQVRLGWYSGDSDISLAAYTGGGSTNLSSMEYSELTSNGWTTIGSYYDVKYDTTPVNGGEVASSFWLISALNPYLGGESNTNYYANDFFKLKAIAGFAPPPPPSTSVPEPSTLLLLGGALLIMTMRGRKAGQNDSGLALQA